VQNLIAHFYEETHSDLEILVIMNLLFLELKKEDKYDSSLHFAKNEGQYSMRNC
jgi:hypothetical protein